MYRGDRAAEVGGVASILNGPRCAAPVAQLPALSTGRMWKYQSPSARAGLVVAVIVPMSFVASGTVAGA